MSRAPAVNTGARDRDVERRCAMPYMRKVLALFAAGVLRKGRVYDLEIQHDDDCPRLHGGACRCDPFVLVDGRRVEVPTT